MWRETLFRDTQTLIDTVLASIKQKLEQERRTLLDLINRNSLLDFRRQRV